MRILEGKYKYIAASVIIIASAVILATSIVLIIGAELRPHFQYPLIIISILCAAVLAWIFELVIKLNKDD